LGRIGQDAKNLILGNDGSDKEPVDFKTELQNAINAGIITKAEGTLLITSRANCDKLAEMISKNDEKEVTRASKEDGKEFEVIEDEKKERKEKARRQTKVQEMSLEQQIQASQNEARAKIKSETESVKQKEKEINK